MKPQSTTIKTMMASRLFRQNIQSILTPALLMTAMLLSPAAQAIESAQDLRAIYEKTVIQQVNPPEEELQAYTDMMAGALNGAGVNNLASQFIMLVDRNPKVQVGILFWIDAEGVAQFMGASPVSTGRGTGFEHFETPTGVFAHTVANLDYRAEGTKNSKGVRGYGEKGRRVFDFGWQPAKKGWGDKQIAPMRFQVHATDPHVLESRLWTVQSKGCVRIPATLNQLLDRYALLDADYNAAVAEGRKFWVLGKNREDNRWAGKYLVVVDSARDLKPDWTIAAVRQAVKRQ